MELGDSPDEVAVVRQEILHGQQAVDDVGDTNVGNLGGLEIAHQSVADCNAILVQSLGVLEQAFEAA